MKSFFKLTALVALGLSAQAQPAAPIDLHALGDKIAKQVSTRDEVGEIDMTIIEAGGASKTRSFEYSRLNNKGNQMTLMRMQSPRDLKGTALLSVLKFPVEKGLEDKWIYLPSSKQTRRIATASEGNSRVLDSELYNEDFDLASIKGSASRLVKTEIDGTLVIETTIPAKQCSYSKTMAWIGKDNLMKKAMAFDKKGALLKRVEFSNYTQVGDHKWRAGEIHITNVQNKRRTNLVLKSVKVDQNLQEKDFTERALAQNF